MKNLFKVLVAMSIVMNGCSILQPSGTQSNSTYSEDLSAHRIQYEKEPSDDQAALNNGVPDVKPTHDDTAILNTKLAKITQTNKKETRAPGYTIQVYSGSSREAAAKAKARVYQVLPDARPITRYDQPVYKVKVGQFADRLEAQGVNAKLKEIFPNALVIPERIRIDG